MLSRWLPPHDEGASLLRLLKLLPWQNPATPTFLCGPFYEAALQWNGFCTLGVTQLWGENIPTVYNYDLVAGASAVFQTVVWRINLLCHLLNQIGVMVQYFPTTSRRHVASLLHTCLDSMYPLLDKLEANPGLDLATIVKLNLMPEERRHFIIDSSCTYFVGYLMPYIFGANQIIPKLVLDILGCNKEDPSLHQFLEILRQLCLKRDRQRAFLNNVFAALRGDGCTCWLSALLLTIMKYALLGNFPDAEQYAPFASRRKIYALTAQSLLSFLSQASPNAAKPATDVEQGIVHALLAVVFTGSFSMRSIDYMPFGHLVKGLTYAPLKRHEFTDVLPFFQNVRRIVNLVANFFPAPARSNLVADIYRFYTPLERKFSSIFAALHAQFIVSHPYDTKKWHHLHGIKFVKLQPLVMAIILENSSIMEDLESMQLHFEKTNEIWQPPNISPFLWNEIGVFSAYVMERACFAVINGSQVLYFEQAARLLAIAKSMQTEKTSILYCNSCSTIRFRPVGIRLPSSHITLLADLNFNRVHCVDCDSFDLYRINLLGKYVRCYLSNKKNRTLVTLALCSACLHVCVCGFYACVNGVICKECQVTVAALQNVSKACFTCGIMMSKYHSDAKVFSFVDSRGILSSRHWCNRCMPNDYKKMQATLPHLPLFSKKTLLNAGAQTDAARGHLKYASHPKGYFAQSMTRVEIKDMVEREHVLRGGGGGRDVKGAGRGVKGVGEGVGGGSVKGAGEGGGGRST
jgi:hypothetical protein